MRKIHLLPNPLDQFQLWYEETKAQKQEADMDAMILATVSEAGKPSARVVLFKGIDQGGFLLYTNYQSRKAVQLVANASAALVFYWPTVYKQIRIEGQAQKITRQASQKYFQSRPYESQISAWVSPQSQEVPDREYLLTRYKTYQGKFTKDTIPCPEYWGGFRLIPDYMEFWIGQDHRLHDRFCYQQKKGQWQII